MTFFLSETPNMPARGPNVPLPSNSEGVGAAVTSYFREIDSFNGAQAYTEMEKANVGRSAGERIGIEELNRWYQENDAGYDHLRKPPKTVDEFIAMHGQRGSDMILDIARERAVAEPDRWKDLDLSPEGIETRVTEQLKAAADADAQLLALSPNPVRNAIVGGLAAGVLDPVNLAAIPLGLGGGSFLRVVGREALINGGIEALQYFPRARTAERLEQEAPSFFGSVAMGMAFGATIGGVVDGIPRAVRALTYGREATKTEPAPDVGPVTQEAAIQKAEAAILDGKPGAEAAAEEILREPAPPRRPLILEDSMRVPEPTPLAPDPISEQPLEPVPSVAVYGDDARNDISLTLREIFDDALAGKERGNVSGVAVTSIDFEFVDAGAKAFLNGESQAPKAKTREGQILSDFGFNKAKQQVEALGYKPVETSPPNTVDQITAVAKGGIAKAAKPKKEVLGWLKRQGVDPDGWLGLELKARGLTHKSYPGLFKRGGLTDADNIVFDELMPEVAWKMQRAEDGNYVDRESILRVLDEEMRPAQPKVYDRDYVPERAWADPDPEDRGFLINDLPARQFAEPERWREILETEVDTYLDSKGVILLPRERAEIKEVAATRGGDIDDLVYSATSRDIDEADQAHTRAMRGEAYGRAGAPWGDEQTGPVPTNPWGEEAGLGPDADRQGGSPAGKPEAAAGDAAAVGARNLEPPGVERTDIGDQYLIPDTRRVETSDKQRQKAELEARQLQSKIRRLNQSRVEDDVDGLFAAKTIDMFDDLTSPQAREFMDANVEAMRAMLEDGDIAVGAVADDGRVLNNLSDILDEIDDEETLIREFNLCRLGGGTTE